MLFLSSAIPLFTHFNLLQQREEPAIHILKSAMEDLGTKLVKPIMLPNKLMEYSSVADIDLNKPENFKDTITLYVGLVTKNTLNRL